MKKTKVAKLTDNSLMPFGMYREKTMANVPADYLLWFYEKGKGYKEVKKYIKKNFDVLQLEIKKQTK